jgi:hypothetical protein
VAFSKHQVLHWPVARAILNSNQPVNDDNQELIRVEAWCCLSFLIDLGGGTDLQDLYIKLDKTTHGSGFLENQSRDKASQFFDNTSSKNVKLRQP